MKAVVFPGANLGCVCVCVFVERISTERISNGRGVAPRHAQKVEDNRMRRHGENTLVHSVKNGSDGDGEPGLVK